MKNLDKHIVGAIVRHTSPFENLSSYKNEIDITHSFAKQWVTPYYLKLNSQSDEWIEKMIKIKPKISNEIILKNLGDFNWRTRSTGSYFAAIKKATHLEDIIGVHLLKSEVCFAGSQYALTLASFNTTKSVDFLNRYLLYYLKKPQLYFDQESVITALKYLDEINNTNHLEKHLVNWENFNTCRKKIRNESWENVKHKIPEENKDLAEQFYESNLYDCTIETDYIHESINSLMRIINA